MTIRDTVRWWVAPPGPDESLSSLLVRVADLYESESSELWSRLNANDPHPAGTVDDPSCAALHRLGQAVGMSGAALQGHRLHDTPRQLAPEARLAICPRCWAEDREEGRPLGDRRAWASVLRTLCPIHGTPLVIPRDRRQPDLTTALEAVNALTAEDKQILALIERFGATLEASLFDGVEWPSNWRGNACSARQSLAQVSFNPGASRAPPLIANVSPSPTLAGFIHGPRHYREPNQTNGWAAFRRLASPCERRAALWIAAWRAIPGLETHLSPGWVDLPGDLLCR